MLVKLQSVKRKRKKRRKMVKIITEIGRKRIDQQKQRIEGEQPTQKLNRM